MNLPIRAGALLLAAGASGLLVFRGTGVLVHAFLILGVLLLLFGLLGRFGGRLSS